MWAGIYHNCIPVPIATYSPASAQGHMYLLSISRPCHYHLAQHDTYKATVLDLRYSGYKVLVIPTTKYIITGTDYHFVIKLKN